VNCIVIRVDKFFEKVYVSVGIFVTKVLVEFIADSSMRSFDNSAFNIGVFTCPVFDSLAS
jgi:hypothetical protein